MKRSRIWAIALTTITLGLAGTLPAQAADGVSSLVIDASVDEQGVVAVATTFTFDAAPAAFTQEITTKTNLGTGYRQVYSVADVTAQGGSVTTEQKSDRLVLTITPTGKEVTVSYTVTGATQANPDGTIRLSWDGLQGLSLPVTEISGKLTPPSGVVEYFCQAGVPGATITCTTYSGGLHGSNIMTFTDGPRAAGEIVQIGATLDTGAVPVTAQFETVWSLGRALSLGWARIGVTAAIIILGGLALWGLWRRARQRFAKATPLAIASLTPDEDAKVLFNVQADVRPGLVGTLIDQSVDPSDIIANLLDLAVRGHLRITEQPRPSAFASRDWELSRRQSDDPLDQYERELLDALAPDGGSTKLSEITATVAPAIGQVQETVYQQVIKEGWFARHPGTASKGTVPAWIALGAAVIVAGLLIGFTTWGLAGLALIAVALIAIVVAGEAPVISQKGASVMAGLAEFSAELHNVPTDLRAGHEMADASRILPYAIVLGGWERWLAALVAADDAAKADSTELDWYHAPEGWSLGDLPLSLESFITTATGRLFTRA